jgi:hypothetical protein
VSFVGAVALVALWFLRRRYNGLLHDSMIYMGRGLADLDPSGVGADYFYRLDGQSSFSVFSKIVDALIPVFGLALSAQLLTVTALVLWLAAMAALAAQLASGRLKWAILICVAAASGAYGGLPLQYAEAFATPRACCRRSRRCSRDRVRSPCSFWASRRCFIPSWRWLALAPSTSICVSKIAAGFISDFLARWA